jgi:hypothetical protein
MASKTRLAVITCFVNTSNKMKHKTLWQYHINNSFN